MPRFSSASSAIVTNKAYFTSTSIGSLTCCTITTPGSYTFTKPGCMKTCGVGLGWPSVMVYALGAGGGGASGSTCGFINGTSDGNCGSCGGATTFYCVCVPGGPGGAPSNACAGPSGNCACWCAVAGGGYCVGVISPYFTGQYPTLQTCPVVNATPVNTCLYSNGIQFYTGSLNPCNCTGCCFYPNSLACNSCSGASICTQWVGGFYCSYAVTAATATYGCAGGGGFGGLGTGNAVGVHSASYHSSGLNASYGAFIGGTGNAGASGCRAFSAATLPSSVSVSVGGGGAGGAGWPGAISCYWTCCCCTPAGCAGPGLYSFSWSYRTYTCGATGCNGCIIICYYT